MVPGLKHNYLMSEIKFADAKYITILNEDEVNIYDGKTAKITISEEAVLRGWRFKGTGLQRISLKKTVKNVNTDTLLINRSDTNNSIKNVYEMAITQKNI